MSTSETAGDDQARQQVHRAVLRHLREHGNRDWQEIAGGLLSGTLTLRELTSSTAYREQLTATTQALLAHRAEIGEVAFQEEGRQAETVIDQLRQQIQDEQKK